jgi:hypothetical protein
VSDLNLQLAYERWRHFSKSGSPYDRSGCIPWRKKTEGVDNKIARTGCQLTREMEGISGKRASLFSLYFSFGDGLQRPHYPILPCLEYSVTGLLDNTHSFSVLNSPLCIRSAWCVIKANMHRLMSLWSRTRYSDGLRTVRPGFESRQGRTGSRAHSAPYPMGTGGSFAGTKAEGS